MYYSEEEAEDEKSGRRTSTAGPDRTFRRARRAWIVLAIVSGFALAVLVMSAFVLHRFPRMAQSYADTLGIAMTVLASVQWLPQVYTTWHLGHLGSLSAVALCLQTPVRSHLDHEVGKADKLIAVHVDLLGQHDHPVRSRRMERLGRICLRGHHGVDSDRYCHHVPY